MTNNNENTNVEEVQDNGLDLSFFMPGQADEVESFKEVVSKRFRNKKTGEIIKWEFKPISTERVDELEKNSMKKVLRNNKVVGKEVDNARFLARVAIETTVYPNLKAADLRKAYKTEDPVEIAKKVLHIAGEYATWMEISNRANGFTDSAEDLEEEVKN